MTTDQASVLAVDNVDNTTARVISASGKVMARSMLRSARVIVAQDPQGAVFQVIQASQ